MIFSALRGLCTWEHEQDAGNRRHRVEARSFLQLNPKTMHDMKKLIVAALAVLVSSVSFGQEISQAVKANPVGFFAGQYQLAYEYGLSDVLSVQLSAGLMGGTGEATKLGDPLETIGTKRSGFIVIPEVRFYPGGAACEGFYAALAGRYRTAQTVDDDGNTRLDRSALGGAFVLGFQKVNTGGYTVDFFVGPQIKKVEASGDLDVSGLFNNDDNVGVRLGVNIGFGW